MALLGVNEVMVGVGKKVKISVAGGRAAECSHAEGPVSPLPTVVDGRGIVDGKGSGRPAADAHREHPEEVGAGEDTVVPGPALIGVKEEIVGGGIKVNVPLLVAVPSGVAALTVPVAPTVTTAKMMVSPAT